MKIFYQAHLYLREWATNGVGLRQQLSNDGLAAENQEVVKTLGLRWNTENDRIRCPSKSSKVIASEVTKRQCLSITAQLFDPLGVLLPVTIKSRMFLQNLWRCKVEWDQLIPQDLVETWQSLLTDLQACCTIEYPRRVADNRVVELHAFSDASNSAYGAAVYFCCEGISRLVMAKAKVAPIKPVTIPKLELTALLLAARMTTFITDAYQGILEIAKVHLWCDSQIALCWLHSHKVLPVYVNNRVDEIKSLLPNAVYRYVATKENPSDLITRGVTTKQLKTSALWWEGPSWLTHKELWPEVMSFGEESHPITITAAQVTQQILDTEIKWNRFGSFDKLVRVIAWVIHYKQILLARVRGSDVNTTSNLAIGELRSAEENVVKLCQKEAYSKEYKALLNVNLKEPHSNITKQ
ncbi:MAG: hypothetical protein GY928_38295, partial [Colwellia sp.]|nr:hypothetical protein [Colwellia sp.]